MATVDALYDSAIELQQSGKLEEAVAQLEEIVATHPDHVLAHSGLSVFYGKQGRFDEAVEQARKVCELDPDDPFSFMAMSMICQKAGRIAEAEQAMGEAMQRQWAKQP
jgi:Flp pilus assembly protein TadD